MGPVLLVRLMLLVWLAVLALALAMRRGLRALLVLLMQLVPRGGRVLVLPMQQV